MRNESNRATIFVIGIILGAALLYFPPYAWAWVGDDYVQFDYVLEFLKRPLSAIQLFNPYFLPWYYRPTQNLWFVGNRMVFGLNPVPFYWQMVLWHSLATALVYRVLRQFGVRGYSAVLGTVLFAIHGHYVDVVGWNSSIAIVMAAVFSLTSLSAYKEFLTAKDAKGAKKNQYLIFSFLFFVLALVTHEEAILLPLFLLILTIIEGKGQKAKGGRKRVTKAQVLLLVGMLALTAVSIFIQFNRPNLTIDLSETPATQWLELVSPMQIGQFVKDISLRYTLTTNLDVAQDATPLLLAIVVLLILGAWFLLGNWTVRLGLIWVALHLGLIYATLWQSKPNLLAGRHFYQASFGLVLAIGATIDQLRQIDYPKIKIGRWRVSVVMALVVGVITAVLISHITTIQTNQQKWLQRAQTDQSAREQMQATLPKIEPETRVFANRFPITSEFFRSVTEVWYDLPIPIPEPSGSINELERYGRATRNTYVFDYENGKVYNLMPELQFADETIFIWSYKPRLDVVADSGEIIEVATQRGEQNITVVITDEERRFGVKSAPKELVNGWLSLTYTIPAVPLNSTLNLGVRTNAQSGAPVRVVVDQISTDPITIFEGTATGDWLDFTEPMGDYVGQSIILKLETAVAPGGTVYWGNPRFVIGE